MSANKPRPELQAPDLSPIAAPLPPKTSPDDSRFAGAEHLETHDAFVRGVEKGTVRVVNPETLPMRPPEPAAQPPSRRSPEITLSTKIPLDVMRQLRRRYAETGITIRNQVLTALRRDGFEVGENELLDERKRRRR